MSDTNYTRCWQMIQDSRLHRRLLALQTHPLDAARWGKMLAFARQEEIVDPVLYAVVCHFGSMEALSDLGCWQFLAFISAIETARRLHAQPALPPWLHNEYLHVLSSLASKVVCRIGDAISKPQTRAMISLLLAHKGFAIYAMAISENSEEELGEYLLPPALIATVSRNTQRRNRPNASRL